MASLSNKKKNNDNVRLQTELQMSRVTIIMFYFFRYLLQIHNQHMYEVWDTLYLLHKQHNQY